MQAIGVTPPVLNLKSLSPGRAEAYPAMDMFKSLLQQRILARGYGSNASTGPLSWASLKAQVSQARPVSSSSASSRLFAKMPKFTVRTASSKGSRDPLPMHITEKLSNRNHAQRQEKSSTSLEQADSSSRLLKNDRRSRTLSLVRGKSDLAKSTGAVVPDGSTEMPPTLKALKEVLNQQPGQALKVSQEQVPQVRAFLIKAGLPAEQVDKLLNASSFATKGLSAADLQAAWLEACQNSKEQVLAAQVAQGAPATAAQMPTALKSLIDFLNQQPGQNLKVPADRLPEVENFLLRSGISPEQVENLLSSPRFQEQGLTAAELQSAWQNSLKGSLASQGVGQSTLASLTSQSDYREMWQNLTLPPQSLANLRLALQELGVAPEAVAKLTEQNYPQGLPLNQVWQLLQQAGRNTAGSGHSPLLLNGAEDMQKWQQLLEQAGMDQDVAQTLVSNSSPATREELRTSLLKMAPPAVQVQGQDVPQPLYLPQSLRVRAFPMWQQQFDLGQGGSGESGSGNLTQNFTFSSQSQGVNFAGASDLNNFLAMLNGDTNFNPEQFTTSTVAGSPTSTVNGLLTPEAREALWTQMQAGVLGNLRPGMNQVTLTLNPPDMGKLHLSLNVRGDLVEVSAIASHASVAEAGAAGVQQLAQALSQQGLTLTQFQFHHQDEAPGQSNLAFFQNSGGQRQTGKQGADRWEQPPDPQRRRWAGGRGIDCFA